MSEFLTVESSILAFDHENKLLIAGGPVVADVLGDSVPEVAQTVAAHLWMNPDKTIYAPPDEVEASIADGATGLVVGIDEGVFNGHVHGFARLKRHKRETYPNGKVRDKLEPWSKLNLDKAIEVGSMLGYFPLDSAANPETPVVGRQGSRALSVVTHLASWDFDHDVMAATNQLNGRGADAVVDAGGFRVGSKTTTRLEHPNPGPGEPSPKGDVMVNIYHMRPKGDFMAFGTSRVGRFRRVLQ